MVTDRRTPKTCRSESEFFFQKGGPSWHKAEMGKWFHGPKGPRFIFLEQLGKERKVYTNYHLRPSTRCKSEPKRLMIEPSINPVWANIWSLRVPAKVKIFSWKLLHGTLACKGVLANWHIIYSSLWRYSTCFFQMPQSCWNMGKSWPFEAFFIYDTLVNLNGIGLRELVKMSCWYMWWERRKIIHEEHVLRPARSAQAIQSLTLNYDRALKKMQEWEKKGGRNQEIVILNSMLMQRFQSSLS
jgi:hypothetical protein